MNMKLYIYDHCPFCVRARMIFGLRGVEVENIILANDDENTPIGMIGAKQVPILEKDDGIRDAGDFIEAKTGEKRGRSTFRVEKDGGISAFLLDSHEMREDDVQQAFALVAAFHGKAAQRIFVAAAGRDDLMRFIENGTGVVDIGIHTEPFFLEQGAYAISSFAV